jgi:LytS/YehU family sensor histidine kinase
MDFVQRYLDIEKVRFQDRMTVTTDIAHDTLTATVPNLVLQPLVENAIRHGISARSEPGEIEIRARRDGDRLLLTVRDDGNGLRDGWRPGLGMSNVRARLAQLYPDRHRLELRRDERGGTLVTLEIPFTEEAA